MATTYSVTAVVAAKEEVKQAVADDLNSTHSSPCEWFICDDDQSATRFSGFETLASWQTNLLFEPVQFEEFDVLVHRGIYEAAKGIFFLPVVTFGSPSIMCGGDGLLRKLGLPRSHVQAVTMHSDIVPRAFSCNYPNYAAELLKAINGKFRHLPRLENQEPVYIAKLSIVSNDDEEKLLWTAQRVFFNSPHPLEILRDRSTYGSKGTIQRDHDMNSYLKCVQGVIRQELKRIRKIGRVHRRKVWWPLILPCEINDGDIILGRSRATMNAGQE
ncbi:hypothetical protein V6N13_020631 [Hibiscus sabdariffa]